MKNVANLISYGIVVFFSFLFVSFMIVELIISIVMGLLIFLLCSET